MKEGATRRSPGDAEDRRLVVLEAVANIQLSGLELEADTQADCDQYVAGSLSLAEVRDRIEARYSHPSPRTF